MTSNHHRRSSTFAAPCITALAACASIAHAQTYVFEDLGAVSVDSFPFLPNINNSGQVVCTNGAAPFQVLPGSAARFPLALPPGATLASVRDTNNLNLAVGSVVINGINEACAWLPNGAPVLLTPVFGNITDLEITCIADNLATLGAIGPTAPPTFNTFAAFFNTFPPGILILNNPIITGFTMKINTNLETRGTGPTPAGIGPVFFDLASGSWQALDPTAVDPAFFHDHDEGPLSVGTVFNSAGMFPGEFLPNATTVITALPNASNAGEWFATGGCNAAAAGGHFFDPATNTMRGLYRHAGWTGGAAIDANSLVFRQGTAPKAQLFKSPTLPATPFPARQGQGLLKSE